MNRKVLYIHDGPRWYDAENIQWGFLSDLDMKKRYSYLGEKVDYMMRISPLKNLNTSELLKLNDHQINVISVPSFNRPKLLKNYFKASSVVKSNIKKYDILIIRLPSTIGTLALKYAKKYNIPHIIEVVACPWDALWNYSLLGKMYAPFSALKLKKNVRHAPYVIYVTKKFLQSRYPNVEHNLGLSDVVIDKYGDSIIEKKVNRFKELNTDDIYHMATLAAIGVAYKNQQSVIKAIAQLKAKGYNVIYHLAGNGNPDKIIQVVKKYNLREQVVLHGLLNKDSVVELLNKMDIYIQPSKVEGLPRALVEAMSKGCICIGSEIGGIPELLNSKYTFNPSSVNDIANSIEDVINAQDKEAIVNENLKVANGYQPEVLGEKRKEFYDMFIENYF